MAILLRTSTREINFSCLNCLFCPWRIFLAPPTGGCQLESNGVVEREKENASARCGASLTNTAWLVIQGQRLNPRHSCPCLEPVRSILGIRTKEG